MQDAPTPFGPVSGHKSDRKPDAARTELLGEIVDRLQECRHLLDELDRPLAAAHVDMALHVLADPADDGG